MKRVPRLSQKSPHFVTLSREMKAVMILTAEMSKMARMMAKVMDCWWAVSLVGMKAVSLAETTDDVMVWMTACL